MRLHHINNDIFEKYAEQIQFAIDKFNNQDTVIYRGIQNLERYYDYLVRDPRKTRRQGTSDFNYHSLWMEGNEDWKEYPDRFYSVICTSNEKSASDYGQLYVIIPLKNTTIAICPTDDLWNSFDIKTDPYGFHEMEDVSREIHKLLVKYGIIGEDHKIESYDELFDALIELEKYDTKSLNTDKTPIELFKEIYDPIDLKFELVSWDSYELTDKDRREIWFSAPYIAIKPELFFDLCKDSKDET